MTTKAELLAVIGQWSDADADSHTIISNSDLDELRTANTTLRERFAVVIADATKLSAERDAELAKVEAMERNAKSQKELTDSTINGLNAEISALRETITERDATIESNRKAIQALREVKDAMLGELRAELASEQKECKAGDLACKQLMADRDAKNAEIAGLMVSVSERDAKIATQEERITNLIETCSILSERVETMEGHPDVVAAKKARQQAEAEASLAQAEAAKKAAEEMLKQLETVEVN